MKVLIVGAGHRNCYAPISRPRATSLGAEPRAQDGKWPRRACAPATYSAAGASTPTPRWAGRRRDYDMVLVAVRRDQLAWLVLASRSGLKPAVVFSATPGGRLAIPGDVPEMFTRVSRRRWRDDAGPPTTSASAAPTALPR